MGGQGLLMAPFARQGLLLGIHRSFSEKAKSKFLGCCKCVKCSCSLSYGLGLIKCPKCEAFQPAPPTRADSTCCPDYYRLLVPGEEKGIRIRHPFSLDVKALKGEYLRLQGAVHPDRLGSLGEAWSSWINRAHETLKDPLQRAIYLVNLYERRKVQPEVEVNDENSEEAINFESEMHDISLVLDVREELSMSTDTEILSRLKKENDARIRHCCTELESILDIKHDSDDGVGIDLTAAKKLINMLRYWMSIDRQIKEKE